MHGFDDAIPAKPDDPLDRRPWHQLLSRYHWFVLGIAALGWLFDCLDQQLFVLARPSAMAELVPAREGESIVDVKTRRDAYGDKATSFFLAGWAIGGLAFGMLGDRIGRAKTMMITILLYSAFTGLSALSRGPWDFALYRFLTGLGVGGEFAVGVALVAEVMPNRARPFTLGLLQALSAIGNVTAAAVFVSLGVMDEEGLPASPWKIMFCIGALPALLALVVRMKLKEPERWKQASHEGVARKQLGSYTELFGDPVWRKHALLGLLLACSGVIGLWAVGFFTPDLMRRVQQATETRNVYDEQIAAAKSAGNTEQAAQLERLFAIETNAPNAPPMTDDLAPLKSSADQAIKRRLTYWQGGTSVLINIGAFCGMFGFGVLAQRIGRRPTFAIAFVAAFVTTAAVFWYVRTATQLVALVPLMGFCQLSLFAGYAIYFPELFPTRLRSTGTSFCYNVGRLLAAFGPLVKSALQKFFNGYTSDPGQSLRYAGVTMCLIFLVGLIALPFLPETRGKQLPE